MTTKSATPLPWNGPSKHKGWIISAPYQSRIAGPFEAHVYLDANASVRVIGKTGQECHARAVQHIESILRAEAYPELVAALRNLATGVPAHEDYYRAQALLAKLGEGA